MRYNATQLNLALSKNLAPLYLISGDEPLQVGEAADAVRTAAKKAGYLNREVLTIEGHFSWSEFSFATDSLSIFADKKIIDLRVPSGNFGNDGAKALINYCESCPSDVLLLISTIKLSSAVLKSHWFQAVDKLGLVIQVYPLEDQELFNWLQQRLLKRGLEVESAGIKMLLGRIEGNLLAAAQEVEKLYVLYGSGYLSLAQIESVVADSSRFDVFKLTDAILLGKVNRASKILYVLKEEGTAAPVILWALAREARNLIELKTSTNSDATFKKLHIWDNRRTLLQQALNRLSLTQLQRILLLSASADRQIKGQESGDYWQTLLNICLCFTSSEAGEQFS